MASIRTSQSRRVHSIWQTVLILLLVAAVVLPAGSRHAHASVPKLDTIRVALFLQQGKLNVTVPAVTLQATSGTLSIHPFGYPVAGWPSDQASSSARASLDQFKVLVWESEFADQSLSLASKLRDKGYPVSVLSRQRSGKTIYQVMAGAYPDQATAEKTANTLGGLGEVQSLGAIPTVRGNFRLLAGEFGQATEAGLLQTALGQAGIDSNVAIIETESGVYRYEVWIGDEATEDQLNQLKGRVQAIVPGLSLEPASTDKPYLLADVEVTNDQGSIPHIRIGGNGAIVKVSAQEGRIAVSEKNGRSYRGQMELRAHNGKLALINELPFEQYLYSVVSNEMGQGWPMEALKAQAVAARTYALASGVKYQIAHVSDTTLDQAYNGLEYADAIAAVEATKGEVLVNDSGLITPFYSSNAGGMTSNGEDVWGTALPYLKVVPSPDDGPTASQDTWYHVVLPDGSIGYVHGDYLADTGNRNAAGLPIYRSTGDRVNVRKAPYVDNVNNPAFTQLNVGDPIIVIGKTQASNSYGWERGPYSPDELLQLINKSLSAPIAGPLTSFEITKRGASGRVTELAVNGQPIPVTSPDSYRSVLGGLPSTRFEIEQSGRYTILGSDGVATYTGSTSQSSLYVLNGDGRTVAMDKEAFALNGNGEAKVLSGDWQYIIRGTGYGHGVGMSQWGARGLAELGYDYRQILLYYFEGVTLTKE